jgi:starch phosphorylase
MTHLLNKIVSQNTKKTSLFHNISEHFNFHLQQIMLEDFDPDNVGTVSPNLLHKAISRVLRDRVVLQMAKTNKTYRDQDVKRINYFSLEFLMGRATSNNMLNLALDKEVKAMFAELKIDPNAIENAEMDAGLGNGGLGRLAACFLDSLATKNLPARGYGIRYTYGIFSQELREGRQVEHPDQWLKDGNPWEIERKDVTYNIQYDGFKIPVVAYDTPIVGFDANGNSTVTTLRLWSIPKVNLEHFNFSEFDKGNYAEAYKHVHTPAERIDESSAITDVLYPNDKLVRGKMIRLRQQYLLTSASLQNIIEEYKLTHSSFDRFAESHQLQINDTHPALIVPELMRILIDEERLSWEDAWAITTKAVNYTNHTVLPEALETWPTTMIKTLAKRNGSDPEGRIYQIIKHINAQFEKQVRDQVNSDEWGNLSIIDKGYMPDGGSIRMSNLAIVGSKKVNGVAELHSHILKEHVFSVFFRLFPDKFTNVTNGVTQRRWMLKANPELSDMITGLIGDKWITDLSQLSRLESEGHVYNKDVIDTFLKIKFRNKEKLARIILKDHPVKDGDGNVLYRNKVNPNSIFDVQVKRMHEYKRQLMNALHILMIYQELKNDPFKDIPARTFIFGAKAAPGYEMAKDIIHFINILAKNINNDPDVNDKLKVVFMENYSVSLAEAIFPATDVSEQISLAGQEASGTGCMKAMLNGAITVGTYDGANIEMLEEVEKLNREVGERNMFIFGLKANEAKKLSEEHSFDPHAIYEGNPELKKIIDLILSQSMASTDHERFIMDKIGNYLIHQDTFMILADILDYKRTQDEIGELYKNPQAWGQTALKNIAAGGKFSSDRSIQDYADNIWGLVPVELK